MYVSHESAEQTSQRLLKVIAQTEFKIYQEAYMFDGFPLNAFQAESKSEALALIRDELGLSSHGATKCKEKYL